MLADPIGKATALLELLTHAVGRRSGERDWIVSSLCVTWSTVREQPDTDHGQEKP